MSSLGEKFTKHDEYYCSDSYYVVPLHGHILELKDFEEYPENEGKRMWSIRNLPFFPQQYEYRISRGNKKIYDTIDASGFYRGTALKEYRSNMNVTWRIKNGDEALEKLFLDEAKKLGMSSLKGHRSVGGLRASIYNAFPMEGVDALVSFMKDFEKKNG